MSTKLLYENFLKSKDDKQKPTHDYKHHIKHN